MKKTTITLIFLCCTSLGLYAQGGETPEESQLLDFLYQYMALADKTDYTRDFHLQNVRASIQARHEMPWGQKIPELLWRHFVLPERVNNEDLDASRPAFYQELKERVKGMSMTDAILEVNHWCHEHVTYQPSDARTTSPLVTKANAVGRCGEESTFTVAALRAIGIPARQVYTPRWAHTDDNHAWVEAWADGEWHFLGACEPEAVLDLGWFNAPASRVMLTHTRAFGNYQGPEEVVLRTNNYTEINLTDNYAETARIDFRVVDVNGQPVDSARVEFKIYNYAEFYSAITKYTDKSGRTFLSAGKGDMLVWASKNGHYGCKKASFGTDRELTITLDRDDIASIAVMEIVPPAENTRTPLVTPEQQAENKRRFAEEDSIRLAYMHSAFFTTDAAPDAIYLKKARANWPVIQRFISNHSDNKERVYGILNTLSDKDFTDISEAYLEDSYTAPTDQLEVRVENEPLTHPYKSYLASQVSETDKLRYRQNPSLLVEWVKNNIRLNPDRKALRIAQSPIGVWTTKMTDTRSRDIFFVAMARSLDIQSRKDPVTGKVQFWKDNQWVDVNFETQRQEAAPTGTLVLRYEPNKYFDNPRYYSHFSLSRIDDGRARLLEFDEGQVDMGGGVSWASSFKDGAKLDAGTYLLTTGTRQANGSVLTTNKLIEIRAGETTTEDLTLRLSDMGVTVIGSFDSESKFTTTDGHEVSLLSQTGRGYFALGVIATGQEPTNHALRDIAKTAQTFNEWGRPLILLFEDETSLKKFHAADYGQLPSNIIYGIDTNGDIRHQIAREMKMQNEQLLPMFIISDTFNRVVFSSQGYTIGLGEQMEKVIRHL